MADILETIGKAAACLAIDQLAPAGPSNRGPYRWEKEKTKGYIVKATNGVGHTITLNLSEADYPGGEYQISRRFYKNRRYLGYIITSITPCEDIGEE